MSAIIQINKWLSHKWNSLADYVVFVRKWKGAANKGARAGKCCVVPNESLSKLAVRTLVGPGFDSPIHAKKNTLQGRLVCRARI